MPQIANQSEESKAIKRVNQRIAELTRLQSQENPYISAYSRAIHELGLDYKKDSNGRYKIRNTQENRKKAAALEKRLNQLKAKTATDIRNAAKAELKKESAEMFKELPRQQAAKARKEYTSKERVNERIREKLEDIDLSEKLQVIYQATEDGEQLGRELSRLTKGKSYSERDSGSIYNVAGRINQQYRDIQRGNLKLAERQRKLDNRAFYRNFKR